VFVRVFLLIVGVRVAKLWGVGMFQRFIVHGFTGSRVQMFTSFIVSEFQRLEKAYRSDGGSLGTGIQSFIVSKVEKGRALKGNVV
jgi:hypothetical protein